MEKKKANFSKNVFRSNHASELLKKLNSDRNSGNELCDISITVASHEFPLHKSVVCGFSDFFKNIFLSEMKEKHEKTACINGISVDTMETILSFIYTSEITITNYNVYDVLAAADYMQIPNIKEYCRTFLRQNINVDNCLSLRAYALASNDVELIGKAESFICDNFASVCKEDLLRDSTYDDFTTLLQLKDKKVSEEVIYHAMIGWIEYDDTERKQYLNKLLLIINFDKLSNEFLQDVVSKQVYVMNSLECSNMIVHALLAKANKPNIQQNNTDSVVVQPSQQAVQEFNIPCGSQIQVSTAPKLPLRFYENPAIIRPSPQPSTSITPESNTKPNAESSTQAQLKLLQDKHQKLAQQHQQLLQKQHVKAVAQSQVKKFLVMGGAGHEKSVVKFDFGIESTCVTASMKVGRSGAAAARLNQQVYIMGGQTNKVEKLNLQGASQWTSVSNMMKIRRYVSAAVLGGFIYAYGGMSSANGAQVSGEKYDHNKDTWEKGQNMQEPRAGHALVAGQGQLCAVGGWRGRLDSRTVLDSIEFMDVRCSGGSSHDGALLTEREDLAAVFLNSKIYTIGGCDADDNILSSVECYDVRRMMAQEVAPMHHERSGHSACVVGGKIYVFGGGSNTIEVYDPLQDRWTIQRYFGDDRKFACVVPIL
ncbi:kelch-like protein 23 isoform X2 [Clavelina lepadiformis]|uniref:kelch-like protein 23 isoform X2 n=1 Tax=Clavelina lepadiformis TaxID=159417 RepID=UPI0040423A2F